MADPASFPDRDLPTAPGASFDALVRDNYARLCNFAYRFVGSRDVAEDIVQDVLARLWRKWDGFEVDEPVPYLYQAVRNSAVSHRRRQNVRDEWQQRAAYAISRDAASIATDADLEVAELRARLARAIANLPERSRLVFMMNREQHLTYGQIAEVLGVSVKTVETQMGRALKKLRAELGEYFGIAVVAATSAVELLRVSASG